MPYLYPSWIFGPRGTAIHFQSIPDPLDYTHLGFSGPGVLMRAFKNIRLLDHIRFSGPGVLLYALKTIRRLFFLQFYYVPSPEGVLERSARKTLRPSHARLKNIFAH